MKHFITRISSFTIGLVLCFFATQARGQELVYSENFDTDTTANWIVNMVGGSNYANVFFDYSTVGIPPAPHSTGATTRGLKMQANLDPNTGVFPSGVSVSPLGFGITENFEMRFDLWINFNGPLPAGGSGSTQVGGAGYGTAGTTAQVAGTADSVFIGATGDGGSSADYRVYSPAHQISYQDADHIITGDTNSPLVYFAGGRNNTAAYYQTNFPGTATSNTCPAQIALYPQQGGTTANGSIGMKWRDVALKKVANTITYSIDGHLIATVDARDAGTLGGTNILFNHYDINATVSSDTNRFDLAFTLIDNVRITNFPNVVSVEATNTAASEAGPTAGIFTITRTSAGVPLTVDYTLSGTASNGVDFSLLSGSVTFLPTATSTNVSVVPIDDAIAEATETVILSINESTQYVGAGSAIINIADNEPPQLSITPVFGQTYERTNDYARFRITRLGDLTVAGITPNISFSGTATLGTDFYADTLGSFASGEASQTLNVYPIEDATVEGDETIIATIAPAGSGEYTIGTPNSATATIVDANLPAETVLFSDNFNTDSSLNWKQVFVASPDPTDDYSVQFAYDYSVDAIPSAPHSAGDTHGLRLTVNKNDSTTSAAALNLYPLSQSFTGNFALRFDMYLIDAGGTSATEYGLFGINHSGNQTNWFRGDSGGVPTGWTFDGIFFGVETDGAASRSDFAAYSSPNTANNPTELAGANASGFTSVFKSPPWAVAGIPSNLHPATAPPTTTPMWADVEVSQVGNVVTLKINNTQILSFNNTNGLNNGNIMLGYADAFGSVGPPTAAVLFDNVRVVRLTAAPEIKIGSIAVSGGTVTIDFTSNSNDPASAFVLQAATVVIGPYGDVPSATITQLGPNTYRATTTTSGEGQFYRIRHQ